MIADGSTIKDESLINVFAGKLRRSNSVLVCMRFRTYRYVAALFKQPVLLLFTSLCRPGQDQSGTFCHFAFQTSIATAAERPSSIEFHTRKIIQLTIFIYVLIQEASFCV
jgi:hypothetical protein